MGDFPLMTDAATFIINGSERVVVCQLIRSPGVYFAVEEDRATGRELAGAKLIPSRGAWLEFETSKRDIISVKVDRKRKLPVTILLRAVGFGTDDEIRELFADVDNDPDHPFIESTIASATSTSNLTTNSAQGVDDALLEFYKKLRPGDPPTLDNARSFVQNLFFTARRYDLGRVGRYKLNRRLCLDTDSGNAHADQRGPGRRNSPHHRHQQRACTAGRHRSSWQPPREDRRRADPEPAAHWSAAHGAGRARAHVDSRPRAGHAAGADQHPAGGGCDARVLWRQPAQPVHGPDESVGRTDAQATAERAGPGRSAP